MSLSLLLAPVQNALFSPLTSYCILPRKVIKWVFNILGEGRSLNKSTKHILIWLMSVYVLHIDTDSIQSLTYRYTVSNFQQSPDSYLF